MSKKRSPLWNYFKEDEADKTNAICKVGECKKVISRGKTGTEKSRLSNTGMRGHLKSCHKSEYDELLAKEKEIEAVNISTEVAEADADETENLGAQIFNLKSHKKRSTFFQQDLRDMVQAKQCYDVNDPRAKEKHRGILMMIVTDLQPFSIVNDPGFLHFSKLMDPRFTVASDIYYRRLLEKCFKKGMESVQKKLKDDEPASVSLQLDGWSAHKHGYMGLLINYITKDWRRAKLCLVCTPFDVSHSGLNVARWLESECDKWGVTEDVGVVTTDTAANMLKMMEYLPIHFLHGGCLNHIIQLVIKDELLEKPSIKVLVKTCRHICTYANQSVQLSQYIVKKQMEAGKEKHSCLNLIQDVVTRWNSTYLMLKRFLVLQPHVRSALTDQEWKKRLDSKISNAEWGLMEKVVKVLGVFYEATDRFSSASACISEVVPTVTGLLVTLSPGDGDDH